MKKSCLIISLMVVWALLGLGPVGPAPQPSLAQTQAQAQPFWPRIPLPIWPSKSRARWSISVPKK